MKKKLSYIPLILTLVAFLVANACQVKNNASSIEESTLDFVTSTVLAEEQPEYDYFSQPIKFNNLDVLSGLSSNVVNDIYQDQFGIIWIATIDGLNKYDGRTFKVYKRESNAPDSLINNSVWVIYEDNDGNLWIGTDGGLEKYDRASDSFIHFVHDPSNVNSLSNDFVRDILEDSQGNLWVGTSGGGLSRLIPETGEFVRFTHQASEPYSVASNIVRDLYQDSRGYLWVGTWNGLDRFDYETQKFFHFNLSNETSRVPSTNNLRSGMKGGDIVTEMIFTSETQFDSSAFTPANKIMDINEDIDGRLWLATLGGGLRRFNPINGNVEVYQVDDFSGSLSDNNVTTILPDSKNHFWFGTNDGLNLYDRQNDDFEQFLADPLIKDGFNTISNGKVTSILEDSSGMYWIATAGGGIDIFSPSMNRFQHVRNDPNRPSSLSSDTVWDFWQDYDGALWVANDDGVDMMRQGGKYFIHYDPHYEDLRDEDDSVYAILRDSKGRLWIGTSRGLSIFNYAQNRFYTYLSYDFEMPYSQQKLEEISITDLLEGFDGHIWMGTYGQGVLELNPNTGRIKTYRYDSSNPSSLSSNIVNCVLRAESNGLWIGTIGGGLNYLDLETREFSYFLNDLEDQQSISDNNVTALQMDSSGSLWVGTYNGLNVYDPQSGSFKSYTIQDGLASDLIFEVIIDSEEIIWMSSSNGLTRLDPETEDTTVFTYRDGLQRGEFVSGSGALGKDGAIYFGGLEGYNFFYPDQLRGNTYVPPIILTDLTQSGERLDLDLGIEDLEELTLKWPDNYFEFEFSALNYVQPQQNEYAYILEGFEDEWNYVGTRAYGRYTNLPQGDYQLHLVGSNNDGMWNMNGKTIQIRVIPAWWESQWFRISGVLLIALAALSFYRLQIGNIERYNRRLANEVQERTRDIERRRRVSEGLREILIRLNSNLPVRESIDYIACQVGILLSARNVLIVRSTDEKRMRTLAAYASENCQENDAAVSKKDEIPEEVVNKIAAKVRSQKQISIQYLNVDSGEEETFTGVPIFMTGGVYGALIIQHGDLPMNHEDLELLKSFADQVGLAIANDLLRSRAEEMAVVSERNRIARDLHDSITQTLFSANLIAETINAAWNEDRTKALDLIGELRQLNQGALAEMRTLLLELRPASVIETDFDELLEQLANVLRGRASCQVKVKVKGICRLPEDVHVGLYRIAQEAATNIMKHASARNVRIQLICSSTMVDDSDLIEEVKLVIEDDGKGFDHSMVSGSRFGLVNMQQRASAIGAVLKVKAQPGLGTSITVIWKEREDIQGNE